MGWLLGRGRQMENERILFGLNFVCVCLLLTQATQVKVYQKVDRPFSKPVQLCLLLLNE
jgi:hypothetical protein